MLPLVEKPATIRDLGPVDPAALRDMVQRVSETSWSSEDARKENAFEVFHHTRHIVFRFIPENRDAEDFYDTPGWQVWRGLLQPVMDAAIRPLRLAQPVFPKAMLARLEAGKIIDSHVDGAGSNLRTHKIHVPLVTNPAAKFTCGAQAFHLDYGRAWEVNNIAPHGGVNAGTTDRIHLIFEVFDRVAAPAVAAVA